MYNPPQQYLIKYKEFNKEFNRLEGVVRSITRAASSQREAENKAYIQFPRCFIVSCYPI